MANGGKVEIADLGNALVIVPAGRGGLRAIVRKAINDAGGYKPLAAAVGDDELD